MRRSVLSSVETIPALKWAGRVGRRSAIDKRRTRLLSDARHFRCRSFCSASQRWSGCEWAWPSRLSNSRGQINGRAMWRDTVRSVRVHARLANGGLAVVVMTHEPMAAIRRGHRSSCTPTLVCRLTGRPLCVGERLRAARCPCRPASSSSYSPSCSSFYSSSRPFHLTTKVL
jgi:hypothetical protein